jgi:UDP-N-acetylmuramoylalanine--D-glutamate ligase
MDLRGRKVTILGLGRHGGGVAAARYCAEQGAAVTVTDLSSRETLADSLARLTDVPIARYTLGLHTDHDFRNADVVVVNPAVRPENRFVEVARQHGATITSETELFLNASHTPVIAVTGTVGKSTTASMLTAVLQAAGCNVWLGGNIGNSLLPNLTQKLPVSCTVLEVSSFQLSWLSENAKWPRLAIVTNCSPNHLDWHSTWEHYVASKQRLLTHLPANGLCVLNTYDPEVLTWQQKFDLNHCPPQPLESIPRLRIPGEHNRLNAALVASMAMAIGVNELLVHRVLTEFTGLPHRLNFVAEIAGRHFYNDSKSTTPASTIAALTSMDRPTWLLLGGADKQIDLAPLAREVAPRAKGVATYGTVAAELHEQLKQCGEGPFQRAETLAEALTWGWQQSEPGDAILLSPACASTDQFQDYAHRGEEFERLVKALPPR